MVLRLDGTDYKFFILANENIVPDLDANRYLRELRNQKLIIAEAELIDGKILEVHRDDQWDEPKIGNLVSVDSEGIEDGKYQLAEPKVKYYEIKDGRIFKIFTETKYINPEGLEIFIHQQNGWEIKKGECVFILGKQSGDVQLNFSKSKRLIVREGKVIRLERKIYLLNGYQKK